MDGVGKSNQISSTSFVNNALPQSSRGGVTAFSVSAKIRHDFATPLSKSADEHIEQVLQCLAERGTNISEFSEDKYLEEKNKRFYRRKMSELVRQHGFQSATRLLQQWPANKRGQVWFALLTEHLFQYATDIESQSIMPLKLKVDGKDFPHLIHQTVLEKFQYFNAVLSSKGYCQFMTWLLQWPIMADYPQVELLKNIPEQYRKMRPDFPVIEGEERAMNEYCGWGFMGPVSDYLAHTKRLKYLMVCSFIENAPKPCKEALLNHWLKGDADPNNTDTLFSSELHPLSMDVFETQLHHSLLYLIDSLLPDCQSGLRDDFNRMSDQSGRVEYSDDSCFICPKEVPKAAVFGRTFYHQDCQSSDGRFHYLKVQNHSESTKDLQQQFLKLEYFAKNRKKLGLLSTPVYPEKLLLLPQLSDTLLKNGLSKQEKAKIQWTCSGEDFESTFDDLLDNEWDHSCYLSASKAKRTRWTELLDDNSCLPDAKKQKLTESLASKDAQRVGIQFSCNKEAPYNEYVYQSKTTEAALAGLHAYAHDFGLLWSRGVIAPDACSAYHDQATDRKFEFLAPYNMHLNVGRVGQWLNYSTDFPNIGPAHTGMRDMGDAFSVDDIDVSKLYPEASGFIDPAILRNRARLEYLAKAAWGIVLEYGRGFHESFNHTDSSSISSVESHIGGLLAELFSQSFKEDKNTVLQIMKENGLLAQCAREISYWMTSKYIEDVKNGVIPESVYPNYKGVRVGHRLSPYQQKEITDEGFRDNFLGARNQPNPLLSLNAMVVKMLSHGCLHMREIATKA